MKRSKAWTIAFACILVFLTNFSTAAKKDTPVQRAVRAGIGITWIGPDQSAWIQLFDTSGRKINHHSLGGPFLIGETASSPSIALLKNGNAVVAYTVINRRYKAESVKFQFYDHRGKKIETSGTLAKECFSPHVVMSPEDELVFTWVCRRPEDRYVVLGARYDTSGKPIKKKKEIIHLPYFPINYSIAPFPSGGYVITWRQLNWDDRNGPTSIKAQLISKKLKRKEKEILIASYPARAYAPYVKFKEPVIATLKNDSFIIIWRAGGGKQIAHEEIYGRLFDRKGIPFGKGFIVNSPAKHVQLRPFAAGLADGGFVAIWEHVKPGSDSMIRGQRFDAQGKKRGMSFQVDDGSMDTRTARVAGLPDGGFAVTWYSCRVDGVGCELFSRVFDKQGKPVQEPVQFYPGYPENGHLWMSGPPLW